MSAFKCAATLRCTALFVFGMAHSFNASAADFLQYRAFATQQQASAGLYGRSSDFQTVHSVSLDSQRTYNQHSLQFAASSWLTLQSGADRVDSKVSEAWWGYDVGNWQWSIGKRKRDFDVNFAMRPLDMFSPTDPFALYSLVAPGVLQVAGDWFGDGYTMTLLCNQTQPQFLNYGQPLAASWGCGARWYQQVDALEWQAVAHHDTALGYRVGASLQQVINDAFAWQSSLLWQQHSMQTEYVARVVTQVNPSTTPDLPLVRVVEGRPATQWSIGLNYTSSLGFNLLAEYGYDGQAPAAASWQAFRDKVAQGPLQPIELQTSLQLFASAHLSRQQYFLHVRRSGEHALQPVLSVMYQPAVRGLLINGSLSYSAGEHSQLSFGFKRYLGPQQGAFALLGLHSEAVAGFQYVF
ncbi:MAG TPA: hypothetical protein DCS87_00735 [Rheinheimera sp.]|nr:hypothetical protein [Rheinheimera sp.]